MTDHVSELRTALAAGPDNTLLRLMLVRTLIERNETSEAMTHAMALTPETVTQASDRALLAGLFKEAGLGERAATWADGSDAPAPAASDAAPATTVEAAKDAPPVAPEAPEAPVAPARGLPLRVVGGNEAAETADDDAEPETDGPVTFDAIGGLEEVKRDIRRRIILPFAQPSLVARFKKKAGGGVLLYGPPGCGKTLLARATAGECGARFLHVGLADVLCQWSGNSEKRLTALFQKARESVPAVLFFDEVEAIAAKRSAATASHVAQLVSHFLQELDGASSDNRGVLVLAATNTPWALDPAFLRPGRFDRLFFVPPPDRAAREAILRLELGERPVAPSVDMAAVAAKTSGASGADLRALIELATDDAIDLTLETGKETPIEQKMLLRAMGTHKSAVGDWLATARDYATYANQSGRYDDVLTFLERYGKAS